MLTWTKEKITGKGKDAEGNTKTTKYQNVEIQVPENPEELKGLSELSWDDLAKWGFAYKRYLQFQACARRGLKFKDAQTFVDSHPISSKAEAGIATDIRKARKAGKLTAEAEAKIREILKDL